MRPADIEKFCSLLHHFSRFGVTIEVRERIYSLPVELPLVALVAILLSFEHERNFPRKLYSLDQVGWSFLARSNDTLPHAWGSPGNTTLPCRRGFDHQAIERHLHGASAFLLIYLRWSLNC